MKERPILFSGEMVRAILDGRKTQMRRVVKPQPFLDPAWGWTFEPKGRRPHAPSYVERNVNWNPISKAILSFWRERGGSPYGQPGDRLWVKETWAPHADIPCSAIYRCDPGGDYQDTVTANFRWRPSIYMPRWASRITLEITSVRVERLQDISEEDAQSEGAPEQRHPHGGSTLPQSYCWHGFRELWQSINGPGSWDANPWVWVIEFRRIQP